MVHERHFDTTFNGVNWPALRDELRPRAASAHSVAELRAVIRDMLGRLGQSHFALIARSDAAREESRDSTGESNAVPGDVGLELRLVNGRFLVTRVDSGGPAAAAGVRPGWIAERAGGCRLVELWENRATTPRHRQAVFRATYAASARLAGDAGTTVRTQFVNGRGAVVALDLARAPERGEPVTFGNLPPFQTRFERTTIDASGVKVGVIRFNAWMSVILPPFDSAVNDMRAADGIVIDLRGNPGGVGGLVMGTSGHFLTERVSLGTLRMRGSQLRYTANPRLANRAGQRVAPFSGPVAILVDGLTGSTSEVFAAGMQAIKRARVFGDTTAGAVLPALNERLPNGDVLYHAFADFLTPDGTRLEGRGVIPDAVVPLTRETLLSGHDAPLDAAVRWIAEKRGAGNGERGAKDPASVPPGSSP